MTLVTPGPRPPRERPMLFSGAMVRALLAGTKTQTRRIVKQREGADLSWATEASMGWCSPRPEDPRCPREFGALFFNAETLADLLVPCPYGVRGDRLRVKETWGVTARWPMSFQRRHIEDRMPWVSGEMAYRADAPVGNWCWRSSMLMPLCYSRITLEITDVRVQRLQEISEEDAKAEGVTAELLYEMLQPLAARAKPKPLHWIDGEDDGDDYCLECCKAAVAKLHKAGNVEASVGGGYGSEEDGSRVCHGCGALLEFTLTSYGAQSELDHYAGHGIDADPDSAYCALAMVESGACNDKLARVGYRFLWDSINGKKAPWSSNLWVWCLTFRRVVLDGREIA